MLLAMCIYIYMAIFCAPTTVMNFVVASHTVAMNINIVSLQVSNYCHFKDVHGSLNLCALYQQYCNSV